MRRINCRLCCLLPFCFGSFFICAQARLVINGAVIVIDNGAALVVDNPDNAAIVRNGSGYIKSERPANRVLWTIGAGNGGNYLIPFGNTAAYLPMQFSAAAGTGSAGYFITSTYPTATWKNSDDLPPGVSNVNRGGSDNSANLIDRFWQLNPQGYTSNPNLTHLVFTYAEAGYAAPNTIAEANLIAQRWNTVLKGWGDYIPPAVVNTVSNTVTVPAVPGSQLYNWWTLADMNAALPVTLLNFKAVAGSNTVLASWQTLLEQNTDHFELWRSKDGQQFEYVGSVAAAGTGNGIANYSFTDLQPYSGTSWYRLKIVDKDSSFRWFAIVSVTLSSGSQLSVFPNPAHDFISITSNRQLLPEKPVVRLYDAAARLLQTVALTTNTQIFNTAMLPCGVYRLQIISASSLQTVSFIKN